MRCEDVPGLLPFHVEEGLPSEEAAGLAAHLASCSACRDLEGDARELAKGIRELPVPPCPARRAPASPRRRLWIPAAAALFFLGAGLWILVGDPASGPAAAPQPPTLARPAPALPGMYEAATGGLILRLPSGGSLSCLQGTRVAIPEKPGDHILLERGTVWCRADSPLQVRLPQGLLRVDRGDAAIRCAGPCAAAWNLCREALAGEGETELVLLAGSRAFWNETAWTGPCRVSLPGSGLPTVRHLDAEGLAEAFAWRDKAEGAGAWREGRTGNLGSPEGRGEALLQPLPGDAVDLVIEVMLKAPAGSQVGLCYPQGASTTYTILGSGALSPGAWQVLRLRRLEGRLEVFADARRLLSTGAWIHDRMAAGHPAAGLLVWQGPVEVRRLRWRPLGAETR